MPYVFFSHSFYVILLLFLEKPCIIRIFNEPFVVFQGAVESVSIGEIKLSFRKSLVKLGFSFISKDPKLQLLICDIEVIMRSSEQRKRTSKHRKSRSTGKGKWLVITSMARFLSVTVTDLVVKVPIY